MRPVKFPEMNCTIAKDQPEYLPLPAFVNKSGEGEVITCWEFTLWERLRLLFNGKIWTMSITFNLPLQPLFFSTKKSDVITHKKKEDVKSKN